MAWAEKKPGRWMYRETTVARVGFYGAVSYLRFVVQGTDASRVCEFAGVMLGSTKRCGN